MQISMSPMTIASPVPAVARESICGRDKRMIFSAIDLALEDGYSEKQKIVGPVDEDYGVEERVAV